MLCARCNTLMARVAGLCLGCYKESPEPAMQIIKPAQKAAPVHLDAPKKVREPRYLPLSRRIEVIRHGKHRMYAGEQRFERFLDSVTGWEHKRGATYLLKIGKRRKIEVSYQREGKTLVVQRIIKK